MLYKEYVFLMLDLFWDIVYAVLMCNILALILDKLSVVYFIQAHVQATSLLVWMEAVFLPMRDVTRLPPAQTSLMNGIVVCKILLCKNVENFVFEYFSFIKI